MKESTRLLDVVALAKRYPVRRGAWGTARGSAVAVNGVSLAIGVGETLGLVGESGSGKTSTARVILRLEEPDSGQIFFDGEDWLALSGRRLRRRRRDLQIIFQDPQTSLNPRMRAGDQIAEPLLVQRLLDRRRRRDRVAELLAEVGLPPETAERFPTDLSGGQRQRIAIARALATRPRLVVCDEPVSSLDVSVAAQVVNLLLDLKERNGLAYLFISHDLALVHRFADRISVMYLGRIVEEGPAGAIVSAPAHPYTVALLSAVEEPDPAALKRRIPLSGEAPSLAEPPPGCPFHPRCPIARPRCREEIPPLFPFGAGRSAACFYPGQAAIPSG